MTDLAAKNIRPEEVDTVFISHLHSDHVGWNVVEQGENLSPLSPNARYVMHQADLDHFRKPEVQAALPFRFMHRCIEPLSDAGLIDASWKTPTLRRKCGPCTLPAIPPVT